MIRVVGVCARGGFSTNVLLMLVAALGVVFPKDTPGAKVPTVCIEAAGSGAILVRALPLREGTTCARTKEMITERLADYACYSFALMLGHGGHEIKDKEIIPTGTDTLVLVRRDPFCMQLIFSDYEDQVDQYSFDFVINGKTIRVKATGEQIVNAYWDADCTTGLDWDIEYEGDKKIFVAMKADFNNDTFQLQLVMYKFDCDENIERHFVCENTESTHETCFEYGKFTTNGTINGVPVVLSIPMTQEYCCTDAGTAWEEWYLDDITIKKSDGENHPLGNLFTTKSFGDSYFAETNFAIVPYL